VGMVNSRGMESYLALRRFTAPLSEAEECMFERLLEPMRAGSAWKRTYRRRFATLDCILAPEIGRRFPNQPVSVHDMAVSSGVTSLELYRLLCASQQVTMRASDYYNSIQIVRVGPWEGVFDLEVEFWK